MPTMAPLKTKPSTLRLSEVARHVVHPSGIESTGWPAVERKCNEFGDEFDQWQTDAGRLILAKRADDSYAATIGGVVISIPRQVAKTFLVGRIIFGLCLVFPGLKVVWTAHRTRTATMTFRALSAYAQRPKVAINVADIRKTNGEQEIVFTNGSIIMFGAREQGFGRGFDEIDVEVFDEAQILTVKALEDMVAATNQSRHPHGALLFYMGTPPRPVDPGEVFTERRGEALAHKDDPERFGGSDAGDDVLYIECSADRDADPDDRKQWAKANPSYPHRTPLRSMLRLRKNLPGIDSWRREALGIWDEKAGGSSVINMSAWSLLAVPGAPETGETSYGVKFSLDGETIALSVAQRSSSRVHIEGISHRPMTDGTSWLVEWLKPRWARCQSIVIDGKANAGAFRAALLAAGCPVSKAMILAADQAVSAHGLFRSAVIDGTLSHLDDEVLTASVASAGKRKIGHQGGWGFISIDAGDITLAESAVLAHFGTTIETEHVGFVPRRIR